MLETVYCLFEQSLGFAQAGKKFGVDWNGDVVRMLFRLEVVREDEKVLWGVSLIHHLVEGALSTVMSTAVDNFSSWLVITLDVGVGAVEEILISVELVLKKTAPQRLFDFAFSSFCALPTRKADLTHDRVDVSYDAVDDDWRVSVFDFVEEFGERSLAGVLGLLGFRSFRFDDVFSEIDQMFEKVDWARIPCSCLNAGSRGVLKGQ